MNLQQWILGKKNPSAVCITDGRTAKTERRYVYEKLNTSQTHRSFKSSKRNGNGLEVHGFLSKA